MRRSTSPAPEAPERDAHATPEEVASGVDLLYERHLDAVFCYVLQRVSDRPEAEDITVETFTAAIGAFSRFRGQCSELTWLLSIARQKIAESARRQESRLLRELPEVELSDQQREALNLILEADVEQLPEDRALQVEARSVMRQLMALLPPPQREALLLQAEYDLPVREIARIMGRTKAATDSLLQRGRTAIFQWGQQYFRD